MKKKNKQINNKDCMSCPCCIPIGEGDHFCDELNELVIEDYAPNDNYGMCRQKKRNNNRKKYKE